MSSNFVFHGHTVVIGQTRSGKTYATVRELLKVPEGVLFFNTQLEKMPGQYVRANGNNCYRQIGDALRRGRKINYEPSTRPEGRERELISLIEYLFIAGFSQDNKIILAVDEVHIYNKGDVLQQLRRVATGGLRFGINGVWISQRPALMDNTLITQCNNMVIFKCAMEAPYFKRYNIPYEELMASEYEKRGDYSYCVYDWQSVKAYGRV
jgi:hypothetical protein